MDEYVPIITPNKITNEKLLKASPPNANNAIAAHNVVKPVKIVREKMSLILLFIKSTIQVL